jgi:hypothetical protein
VVGGSVAGVDVVGGLVGAEVVATGADSGGGATVVDAAVVGSELDGGSTAVASVVVGATSAGVGAVGLGRGAGLAEAESRTGRAPLVGGTSSSGAAVVEVAVAVNDVLVGFVILGAVVVASAANDTGGSGGPSAFELGPCQRTARINKTTSSTAMTARPTVLPDSRRGAHGASRRSFTSMRHSYPTRRVRPMARSTHSGGAVWRRTAE